MTAGLLAGLVAWLAGEATLDAFRPPLLPVTMMGQVSYAPSYAGQARAHFRNATLAYVELGAVLGLALGLAGGLARGSVRGGLLAAVLGAVAGAALTFGTSLAALPFYFRAHDVASEELSRDVLLPMLVHVGAWSGVGLAGGLALGLGLGIRGKLGMMRAYRAALGGLMGAAIGGVVFDLIASLAFQEQSGEPLSRTWATRLIARFAVAVVASAMAAVVAEGRKGKTPSVDLPA